VIWVGIERDTVGFITFFVTFFFFFFAWENDDSVQGLGECGNGSGCGWVAWQWRWVAGGSARVLKKK
jgi:hypothetical protein